MEEAFIRSPLGVLKIIVKNESVLSVKKVPSFCYKKVQTSFYMKKVIKELGDYFASVRTKFHIHLRPQGTDFQKKVWKKLMEIPYGRTLSYSEVACKIGHPKAFRAVGRACGKNPCLILIPCHRVVAKQGCLGGFSIGLKNKKYLLSHENVT